MESNRREGLDVNRERETSGHTPNLVDSSEWRWGHEMFYRISKINEQSDETPEKVSSRKRTIGNDGQKITTTDRGRDRNFFSLFFSLLTLCLFFLQRGKTKKVWWVSR